MRTPARILTVMAATLLMAPASPRAGVNLSHEGQAEESAKRVKELQKERIDALVELVTITTEQFIRGNPGVSFDQVSEAQMRLFQARLDAAEKESERIMVYKHYVEVCKQNEKLAEAKEKAGRNTKITALKAKERRLEAEIYLERAKAKMAKEAK